MLIDSLKEVKKELESQGWTVEIYYADDGTSEIESYTLNIWRNKTTDINYVI